ncbi:hypothetical protein, partial [Escherichia coli]|uniref:hypothetical protein n=1 Tax=Escherichia coli TaxID=562 RepID=UPI00227E690A
SPARLSDGRAVEALHPERQWPLRLMSFKSNVMSSSTAVIRRLHDVKPVNLVAFSLVAGVTTIAAYKVYGEVLLHPEQISTKFDSWVLALLAALTFAVATLGINVV